MSKRPSRSPAAPLVFLSAVGLAACAGAPEAPGVSAAHEDDSPLGQTESALVPSDPVSKAITDSCTTSSVNGLSVQLVAEIQCLRPGTLSPIAGLPNTTLGSAVFPYLQKPAADGLRKVLSARAAPMTINSALRSLAQQYILYRWYRTGRCGISLAASPGRSNHEQGLAVDVEDNAGWRSAFLGNGFRWQGAADPVHYELASGGVNIGGLSVLAFQRLWNRNNPTDRIAEDSAYGPATEQRLARSPVGGFPVGAVCPDAGAGDAGKPPMDGGSDGGLPEPPAGPTPEEPDGPEPDPGAVPGPPTDPGVKTADLAPSSESGCSSGGGAAPSLSSLGLAGLAALAVLRRRRRPEG